MVIVQVIAAYAVSSFSWPLVILAAYVFGGTINHSMALAIHEISHNLAFGHSRPMANRFLGMFGYDQSLDGARYSRDQSQPRLWSLASNGQPLPRHVRERHHRVAHLRHFQALPSRTSQIPGGGRHRHGHSIGRRGSPPSKYVYQSHLGSFATLLLRFSPALSSAKTRHRLGNCQLGSPDFFQCRHSLLFRRKILGLLDLRLLSGDGSSPHGRSLH